MKPVIGKFAEWYKKGYLRKDFMSLDTHAIIGDIAAGKTGRPHLWRNWAGWSYIDAREGARDGRLYGALRDPDRGWQARHLPHSLRQLRIHRGQQGQQEHRCGAEMRQLRELDRHGSDHAGRHDPGPGRSLPSGRRGPAHHDAHRAERPVRQRPRHGRMGPQDRSQQLPDHRARHDRGMESRVCAGRSLVERQERRRVRSLDPAVLPHVFRLAELAGDQAGPLRADESHRRHAR